MLSEAEGWEAGSMKMQRVALMVEQMPGDKISPEGFERMVWLGEIGNTLAKPTSGSYGFNLPLN